MPVIYVPAGFTVVTVYGKCSYEGCDKPATSIAKGREEYTDPPSGHPEVALYCDSHAESVSDERFPEYVETCPNCGCRFGVN